MEKYSKTFIVKESETARKMGSGDLNVLATPAMIAMVENTAKEAIRRQLKETESSVGTFIETHHLRPSKVAAEITVTVLVIRHEGSKIDFSFEVFDGERLVGTGKHQRAVILTEVFLNKMNNLK